MTTPANIDEYLAALPADQRDALQKVREAIRAAAPEATEVISYQIPTFKLQGALIYFGAAKRHCALYGVSDRVMETYKEELAPFRSSDSTIRFTPEKPIPLGLVKKLVKARVKEDIAAHKK
ncbi:MAG: DUF1801 domain-containing protein [Dehalococcoidia bacterium]